MADTPKLVNLIGPDGQFYNGPEEIVQQALANGYRLPTPEDIRRDDVRQNLDTPVGAALTGAFSAADTFLFGAPSAITKQVAPEAYDTLQIAKEANPVAAGLGTAGGIGASLVTGKPVFDAVTGAGKIAGEAIEQGVSRVAGEGVAKAAGTLGRYATEGAAYTLPMAAPEALLGDPEEAAELMAIGAGFGAGAGALGEGTGMLLRGLVEAPKRIAQKVDDLAQAGRQKAAGAIDSVLGTAQTAGAEALDATASVLGTSPGAAVQSAVQKIQPKAVEALDFVEQNQWEKVLGINTKTIRNTLVGGKNASKPNLERPRELVEFAQAEGLLPKTLSGEGSFFKRMEFDANKTLQEVEKRANQTGEELRWTLNQIDKSGKRFVVTTDLIDAFDKLEKSVSRYDLVGADERIIGRIKEKFLPALVKKNGDPKMVKLTTLHDMSKDLGQFIYRNKRNPAVNTEIAQDARWAIRGVLDDALKGADMQFETLERTPISQKWTDLNKRYHDFSDLKIGLRNLIDQEGNNTFTGMTGLLSALGGATVAGLPGLAIGAAGGYFMRNYGPQTAALIAKRTKEALLRQDDLIAKSVDSFLAKGAQIAKAGAEKIRPTAQAATQAAETVAKEAPKTPTTIKNFDEIAENLVRLTSNQTVLIDRLQSALGGLDNFQPQLSGALNGQLQKSIQYLNDHAPRAMAPTSPFETELPGISEGEKYAFAARYRAALDPYTLLEDMRSGVVRPEAIDTVKTLYPKFFEKVSASILQKAVEQKRNYTLRQRAQLALVLGPDVDRLMKPDTLSVLQETYKTAEATVKRDEGGAPVELPGSQQTEAQRISLR